MKREMTTTTFTLEGYRVPSPRRRPRDHGALAVDFRLIGASLRALAGGNISLFTEAYCEKAREEAFEMMLQHAQMGANAVIGVHYDDRGHAGRDGGAVLRRRWRGGRVKNWLWRGARTSDAG